MRSLEPNRLDCSEQNNQSTESIASESTNRSDVSFTPAEAAVLEYIRAKRVTCKEEVCLRAGLRERKLDKILVTLRREGVVEEENGFVATSARGDR